MRSLRRQMILWQALQWALLVIVGTIIVLSIQQRASAVGRENAARQQLTQIQTVLTDVTDLETGMRGYLLTGDAAFLDPYTSARDRLQTDLDTQVTLLGGDPTPDTPVQQGQVRNIETAMQRWFAEVAQPEIAARQRNASATANIDRQVLGRSLIDSVRLNVDRYRTGEAAILDRRIADADNALQFSRLISLLGIALAVVASGVTILMLARNLARSVANLVVGAERFARGDLRERVVEGGPREFVRLARAFNEMASALSTSRDDLNARNATLTAQTTALEQATAIERSLSDMLRLFATSYNRDSIFRDLLALLATRHGFTVSAIYLYNEWSGMFSAAATHGTASDLRRQFGVDEGVIGQAVRDQQMLTVPDAPLLTVDTGLTRAPAHMTTIVPVYYQGRIMAVLTLARYSEPEPLVITFLERLAQQLGIALQNLEQYTNLQSLSEQLRVRGAEIEVKNRDLERADRLKSEFLANMSHELRTPLNAILGFSELLIEQFYGPVNAEQSEYLRSIASSGEHLLALINDILDLSKIEAGRMELDIETVRVSDLLNSSIVIVREKAYHADVHLTLDPGDANATELRADPRKLKQILFNLLSNAVKFTPAGGSVTLSARATARADMGAGVEFSVADTGIGIRAEDQPKLFHEFTQVDSSLTRRHEGTGLGLALTKRLVELHGGEITVESAHGVGSTFTFWLPLAPRDPVSPEGEGAPGARTTGAVREPFTTDGPFTVSPSRETSPLPDPILIVEDDDDTATLIAAYLEGAGYATVRAHNGAEGLAQARAMQPRGIVLDVMMPEMDGWAFLEVAAHDDRLRGIPVIVVSMTSDIHHGWSLGASAVLAKPVRREDLYRTFATLDIPPRNGDSVRVLVVDDDPKAIQVMNGYLTALGHEVIEAYGGEQGVELAIQMLPDLVVLDLMMPEVNGFTVVARLREHPQTRDIPIIILTAKVVTDDERRQLDGYVTTITPKSSLNRATFLAEVNRAVRTGNRTPVLNH